jgi:uncharacterized protein involved in tellurium resistance
MSTDPASAPPRPDLTFLRRRSRPAAAPAPPGAVADLSPAPVVEAPPARRVPTRGPQRHRVPTILRPPHPAATLTRIQSGVGVLVIEAVCPPTVGDLRLGCAYQLADGSTSIAQSPSSVATTSANSSGPIVTVGRGQYERLTIDLRQTRSIARLLVYAFSESNVTLNWSGTLVTTTFGGARIEIPLDRPPSGNVVILQSIYNIRGEFIVRAELEEILSGPQGAVGAYGFDQITWLDQRTPLAT